MNDAARTTINSIINTKSCLRFESKFSKNFQRQIRVYIDSLFKIYTRKFEKPFELNHIEKDFFWIVITYFVSAASIVVWDYETFSDYIFI